MMKRDVVSWTRFSYDGVAIALSGNGQRFALADTENIVRVKNVVTPHTFANLRHHKPIQRIWLSRDGTYVVVLDDHMDYTVYDTSMGGGSLHPSWESVNNHIGAYSRIWSYVDPIGGTNLNYSSKVAASFDRSLEIACWASGHVDLIDPTDPKNRRVIGTLSHHVGDVVAARFHRDGRAAVAVRANGEVITWDLRNLKSITAPEKPMDIFVEKTFTDGSKEPNPFLPLTTPSITQSLDKPTPVPENEPMSNDSKSTHLVTRGVDQVKVAASSYVTGAKASIHLQATKATAHGIAKFAGLDDPRAIIALEAATPAIAAAIGGMIENAALQESARQAALAQGVLHGDAALAPLRELATTLFKPMIDAAKGSVE
jgi:WD40 repeat protein